MAFLANQENSTGNLRAITHEAHNMANPMAAISGVILAIIALISDQIALTTGLFQLAYAAFPRHKKCFGDSLPSVNLE